MTYTPEELAFLKKVGQLPKVEAPVTPKPTTKKDED